MVSKVFIVSNFTIDRIKGLGSEGVGIGGPPYYCALALIHLGVESVVIVGSASDIHEYFSRRVGAEVVRVSDSVPTFELKYLNGSGEREVRLVRCGGEVVLTNELISSMRGSLAIVNPVFKEVRSYVVKAIRSSVKTLAIDVQGFVRVANGYGSISYEWGSEVREVLESADLIHTDLSEAPLNGGMASVARRLAKYVNGVLMVSNGEAGLVALINGRLYYVPALPGIRGESTGTGDILLAISSLAIHEGNDPLRAVVMGAVAAGLKVSRVTPPWFSRYEVEVLTDKLLRGVKYLGST